MKENFREILSDSQIIKREEKFNLRWNIISEEDREKQIIFLHLKVNIYMTILWS